MILEEIYTELKNNDLVEKTREKTNALWIFNQNIARALVLPTLKYGPESDQDWAFSDYCFLMQMSVVQMITSLEGYYDNIFSELSKITKISEIDSNKLLKYIQNNRLEKIFIKNIISDLTSEHYFSEVCSISTCFQRKDFIKESMELFNLDPIGNFKENWDRTFSRNTGSTVQVRHKFVHEGLNLDLSGKLNMFFIKERISDIIILANQIEKQVKKKLK